MFIKIDARIDGLTGEDRLGVAEHIELLIGKGHGLGCDPQVGQLVGVQKLPHRPGTQVADALDKVIPDLFRNRVLSGIEQLLFLVEHQNVSPRLPHRILQQCNLPAHPAVLLRDVNRMFKSGMQALGTAGDQESAVPQFPGNAVGHVVADDHIIAAQLQPFQRRAHLGDDVGVEAQQVAQGMGRACDAGKAHDGVQAVVIFGHFDGAQDVVDRKRDLDHRHRQLLFQQLRRAAAGDHNVVTLVFIDKALRDLDALFQVTGVGFKADLRELFPRHTLHCRTDAFKRRDPKNTNLFQADPSSRWEKQWISPEMFQNGTLRGLFQQNCNIMQRSTPDEIAETF